MGQARLFPDAPAVQKSAFVSECGLYRYALTRSWAVGPHVTFLMVNPSVADAESDDPTVLKCCRLAKAWGFSGLVVVNLYAYRATDPRELWKVADPVGPLNDAAVLTNAAFGLTVAAWGAKPKARGRAVEVISKLHAAGRSLYAIRLTKDGDPEHPLFLPERLKPFPWRPAPGTEGG